MRTTYRLLREMPFLAGLTDWQLERLAQRAQRSVFHAGNRIIRAGDPADRLWMIAIGHVDLDMERPDGSAVVVETLGPGSVLGWSSAVPPYRWHFGAVATETTLTVEVDGSALRELCESDPLLGYQLINGIVRVVADRLEATQRTLAEAYALR
jgi:CRP-like cAMP-binding protein